MNGARVVVVGGGLAGLQAALCCADAGAGVTLLEAKPRLGGLAFSFRREGLWVDNGQHVFLRCCTAYRGLLRRLGVEDLTVLQERLAIPLLTEAGRVHWLRRARLPAPLHLAPALARYGALAPRERFAAARAAVALRRLDRALDDRTFGEWLTEHGQSLAAVKRLWDVITLPTLNLPAAKASLALAAKVFQTGLLDRSDAADLGYARAPLIRLHHDAALRALGDGGTRVLLRSPADSIDLGPPLAVRSGGQRFEADAVIVAAAHPDAERLLPAGAVVGQAPLAGLGVVPIVNVHVVYDRPVTAHPFAAGIDTPVQWVFDRTASSGLDRGQYLAVSVSGAEAEVGWRTDRLRQTYLGALERLFPAARRARVLSCFVTRERTATFRQAPGAAGLRPGPRTGIPGLYLAGAWTDTGWPATMEGAVRSGLAAARAAVEDRSSVSSREEVAT